MLLQSQWIYNEIREEIKEHFQTNENESTTTQNPCDAGKAALRGKFSATQAFLKKQEKPQIKNLIHHVKELEKERKNLKAEGRR